MGLGPGLVGDAMTDDRQENDDGCAILFTPWERSYCDRIPPRAAPELVPPASAVAVAVAVATNRSITDLQGLSNYNRRLTEAKQGTTGKIQLDFPPGNDIHSS